jgi:hypothetical protein
VVGEACGEQEEGKAEERPWMRKRRNLKNVNQCVRLFCSQSFGGMLHDLSVEVRDKPGKRH